VKYINKYATFVDAHTLKLTDKSGKEEVVTADKILIACGGRPSLGGYPGAEECCISSDDIFWKQNAPGKTLVVGASYIALECAGFLAGLGFDVTVMVRSILLRGFDQDIAEKIGQYMEKHGVKFMREMVPTKFEKTADGTMVYAQPAAKGIHEPQQIGEFNTVLMAVGRTGLAAQLNLDAAGVQFNARTGKIDAVNEQTNVENIFAIGDILEGKPELTPVAIMAGRLLADRMFAGATKQMDYVNVPTTVFTPLEYGCVGLSETEAHEKLGKDRVIVYHSYFMPLTWNLNHERVNTDCYIKMVCDKAENEKVIGLHFLGPDAGEVIQSCGVAIKAGATKAHFDDTVGIHPTMAEELCNLVAVKEEGVELETGGGC
jgi:thioredoxin reductase (NADPH)